MSAHDETSHERTDFLLRVAHDLRGPAGVIQGSLDEITAALGEDAGRFQGLLAMAERGVAKVVRAAALLEQTGHLAAEEIALEARRRALSELSLGAAESKGIVKILVVEDDDDSAALLVCLFERQGWSVDTASGVSEAQDALSTKEYSVLVTDLHLPDGTGYDLLKPERPARLHAAVMVTGSVDEQERRKSEAMGFERCMAKPLSAQDIVDVVRSLARGAEVRG